MPSQVKLSFIAWSPVFLSEIRAVGEGLYREVCDQLNRASLSALRNTAEGNAKRHLSLGWLSRLP
jgi:hypothetical protein